MTVAAGSFSSPGVSATYTPDAANSTFNVQLSGTGTGYVCYLTMSVAGAPFTMVFDRNFSVKPPVPFAPGWLSPSLMFFAPGSVQFNMPYTAPGQQPPTYQLVCRAIGGGTINWTMSP